jgi:guanine nucleotide-binding protein subunit alpha
VTGSATLTTTTATTTKPNTPTPTLPSPLPELALRPSNTWKTSLSLSSSLSSSYSNPTASASKSSKPSKPSKSKLSSFSNPPSASTKPKQKFGLPKNLHTGEISGWWEDPSDPVHVIHACAGGEWGMEALWGDRTVREGLRRRRVRMEESSGL